MIDGDRAEFDDYDRADYDMYSYDNKEDGNRRMDTELPQPVSKDQSCTLVKQWKSLTGRTKAEKTLPTTQAAANKRTYSSIQKPKHTKQTKSSPNQSARAAQGPRKNPRTSNRQESQCSLQLWSKQRWVSKQSGQKPCLYLFRSIQAESVWRWLEHRNIPGGWLWLLHGWLVPGGEGVSKVGRDQE